jgi:hypothetical protein
MTFKRFVDQVREGKVSTSDLESLVNVRVPAAEGYIGALGDGAAPAYRSAIRTTDPAHRAAVERAMRSVA